MQRVRISTKTRIEIFERHKGICHMCQMRVDAGQEWDISHEIPLEAGGKDDSSNWLVAHRSCHRRHTAKVDIPLIAKVKRIRAKHLGVKPKTAAMPFGRNSGLKRKMDGTIVQRTK
jgi:hypothetical protein